MLSVWLLHVAEAPRSAQALQIVAASVSTAVFLVFLRLRPVRPAGDTPWLALALALSLFIPLLVSSPDGPERWLVLGNARLYLASMVLPLALFSLEAPLRTSGVYAASVTAAAVALALQPDASQMSAFALGMLVLLATLSSHLPLRLALFAVLLGCAALAWSAPDPLAPVRYVEGVFSLAAEVSPFALLAALIAAALPVIAFALVAWRTRSSGTLAVSVYYASLFALAPLQITPVPLLGFGTGPILGYFLVAGIVSRTSANDSQRAVSLGRNPTA